MVLNNLVIYLVVIEISSKAKKKISFFSMCFIISQYQSCMITSSHLHQCSPGSHQILLLQVIACDCAQEHLDAVDTLRIPEVGTLGKKHSLGAKSLDPDGDFVGLQW